METYIIRLNRYPSTTPAIHEQFISQSSAYRSRLVTWSNCRTGCFIYIDARFIDREAAFSLEALSWPVPPDMSRTKVFV